MSQHVWEQRVVVMLKPVCLCKTKSIRMGSVGSPSTSSAGYNINPELLPPPPHTHTQPSQGTFAISMSRRSIKSWGQLGSNDFWCSFTLSKA